MMDDRVKAIRERAKWDVPEGPARALKTDVRYLLSLVDSQAQRIAELSKPLTQTEWNKAWAITPGGPFDVYNAVLAARVRASEE